MNAFPQRCTVPGQMNHDFPLRAQSAKVLRVSSFNQDHFQQWYTCKWSISSQYCWNGSCTDQIRLRGRWRAPATVLVDSSHSSRMTNATSQTGRWMSALCAAFMYSVMEDEVYEYQATELSSEPCFCSQADFNDKPDSQFFNDGVRKIDFILVYEDEEKKEFEKRHTFQRRKVAVTHDNQAQWILLMFYLVGKISRVVHVSGDWAVR